MSAKKLLVKAVAELFQRPLDVRRALPPHPGPLPWGEGETFYRCLHEVCARIFKARRRYSLSPRERVRVRGNGLFNSRLASTFCLALCGLSAFAQPKITSLSPDWIQRGATLTVTLAGDNLGSVTGLVFSGESGLSGSIVIETNPPPAVTIESTSKAITTTAASPRDRSKSIQARLTAAADASLGVREVRALGANGISSPLPLTIAAVPEVAEVEPNNSITQAQLIPVPAAVVGTIQAATELDYFRFPAHKGDQLVLEVVAQRSGSPLDSTLALLDAQGRELARDEDARGFDSMIEFTVPGDGDYFAQLRDFQYRGGGDYKYRLFVSVLPYVDYIFPFGGQRGKPVEITVAGKNLKGVEKMTLNIDAKAPRGRQEIRLNTPRGLSNPIQFDVQDLPEITEAEPNNTTTNAQAVAAPAMINGLIGTTNDVDRFKFKVAADQKLVCAVEARRFGSPLDAMLAIYAGETLVAQNDDTDGLDARIEFEAKKDVEYTVVLRDLTGRGGNNFTYRLAIRPPTAAAPSLVARYFPDEVRLHRGGRTRVRCEVVRQGFDGPVRFTATDLPAGVSVDSVLIAAGRNEADLLFNAAPEAIMGTVPVKISASASLGGKDVTQMASAIAPQEKTEKTFQQGFLSVFDSAPFTLDALSLAAALDQLQSATVDALIIRRPGFTGDVKLTAVGFVAGREPITKSLDVKELAVKADARTAQLKLTAKVDSELGTRAIQLRGEATENGQVVVQFSQPMALTVAQIPFVLSATPAKISFKIPRAGETNADEATVKVKVERRNFPGAIPLTVEGLPAGVQVSGTNIPADTAEVALVFTATEKAAAGTNYTFVVQGAALHNDRLYRHKTGGVKLTLAMPAAEVATTNAAAVPKEP